MRGLGVRGQVVVELMGALTKQKGGEAKGRNVTPPSMDSGSKASTYGKAKGGTFINSFTQTGTPSRIYEGGEVGFGLPCVSFQLSVGPPDAASPHVLSGSRYIASAKSRRVAGYENGPGDNPGVGASRGACAREGEVEGLRV